MRRRITASVIAILVAAVLASGARTQTEPLTIYAAASLTEVFKAYDAAQNYSFAGSNALETQIRNGAPADVFASAAPLNTQRLFAAGSRRQAGHVHGEQARAHRAEVESGRDHDRSTTSRRKHVKLVIAGAAVPVGGYTRTVLSKMGLTSVLSKVVSQESDVRPSRARSRSARPTRASSTSRTRKAVEDQVKVIRIPAWAQPRVRYEIAVVSSSSRRRRHRHGSRDSLRRGARPR